MVANFACSTKRSFAALSEIVTCTQVETKQVLPHNYQWTLPISFSNFHKSSQWPWIWDCEIASHITANWAEERMPAQEASTPATGPNHQQDELHCNAAPCACAEWLHAFEPGFNSLRGVAGSTRSQKQSLADRTRSASPSRRHRQTEATRADSSGRT